MSFSKKSIFALAILSTAVLTACQNQPTTVTFNTPASTASFNTQNQTVIVNVITQDLRKSAEVASYTSNGNLQRLTAVPDVRSLFQQAMQQNLNSKGFAVVDGAGNVNMLVNVNKFFAKVGQGNFRHKITAEISVAVQIQGAKGNFTKNFNTTRTSEGIFRADRNDIQNVLRQAYNEIIQAIYNDNEIAQAIHQYK